MDSYIVLSEIIRTFRFYGVWPSIKTSWAYNAWSLIFLIISIFIYSISQFLNFLFITKISEIADMLNIFSSAFVVVFKGIVIYQKNHQLRHLISIMKIVDSKIYGIDEQQIHSKQIRICRLIYKTFLYSYVSVAIIIVIQLIFASNERRLVTSTLYYPWEWSKNNYAYTGGVIFHGTMVILACLFGIHTDTYGVILSNVLVGYIDVLGYKLKNMSQAKMVDCFKFYEDILR